MAQRVSFYGNSVNNTVLSPVGKRVICKIELSIEELEFIDRLSSNRVISSINLLQLRSCLIESLLDSV